MIRIDRESPRRFVEIGYQSDDWVAVLLKSHDMSETAQRIVPVSTLVGSRFQAWLRFRNATGANVYLSVNAVVPGRSRTKSAIAAVRHVFLDVDGEGPRVLNDVTARGDVPAPSYVLHTSPGRMHMCWRVSGFDRDMVEALQKSLARDLRTDPAATSCSQMTRLPGFMNHKRELPFLVTVDYGVPHALFLPEDFPRPKTGRALDALSTNTSTMVAATMAPGSLERARQYLARVGPAVSGQHGDVRTFRICCRLVRGFALSDDDALSLLRNWNATCEPPWSEEALVAKLRHARRYGREPIGGLLRDAAGTADCA
jgi:hypothetical protein